MRDSITDKHKIVTWFASNSVVANILMISILVAGIYTAFTVRKEGFPSFAADKVTISVPIRGGNPEDVERGVTVKIEESLESVDGIDSIRSTSSENRASIIVRATENYDVSKLLNDIKVQVDAIQNLPDQAEKPVITETRRSKQVLWIEITGDQPESVLKETARKVKDELLRQPSISRIKTYGSRDYEISIELSEDKLLLYGMTFDEVAKGIQQNSIDLSGGAVKTSRGEISLRIRNQAYTKKEFEKIVLRTSSDGTRILVKDVATVIDGFIDQKFLNRYNGKATVSLNVVTQGNEDIIKAVDEAQKVVKNFSDLPPGVKLNGWLDGSNNVRNRLHLLSSNGLTGCLLVLITLTLFLNFRLALWVAVGIPISFAGALTLFPLPGVDLSVNLISAFGFLVVLGIVVDDAIVIGESIYSEKEEREHDESQQESIRSTVRGVSKVVIPATFGVITTIAAFAPLTQISGGMGNVFGQIATVVIFCLIFSLVESKLILPSHLAHLNVHRKPSNPISRFWSKIQGGINKGLKWFVQNVLTPSIKWMIPWRYAVIAFFIGLLVVVGAMVPAGKVRFVFFPNIYNDFVSVNIELEQGQSVDYLHENANHIAETAIALGEHYKATTGKNPFINVQISASTNNKSSVVAELLPSSKRDLSTPDIVKEWRKRVGPIAGARSLSYSAKAGPPGGDLTVNLESENLAELQIAAQRLKEKLAKMNGVFDIYDSFDSGKPEIRYEVTPQGEAANITQRDLASNIRDAFYGRESQRVQRARDEVRVMVRYPEETRKSLDTLREMRIRKSDNTSVPFSVVAETSYGESLASIERYKGKRVVSVDATVDKSLISAQEIITDLNKSFFPDLKAEFPSIEVSQSGQAEERAKSMKSLKKGFKISLILIFILLAIPLKSYLKPIVIMMVIPFGVVGAVLGHYVIGIPLSILSIFGLLALSGVVVNDSLVLVSRVDELLKQGIPMRKAVVDAAGQRFRAILLTSLTTFFGLYPLLLETDMQAQFLKPMAVSLAYGVAFATFITLVLLPMVLVVFDDIHRFFKWLYPRKQH